MSFGTALNSAFPVAISSTYENGFINGVTNLRSGKGAIYVNSSGNAWYEPVTPVKYCGPNYGTGAYSDLFPCWDSSFDKVFGTPYIIGVASLNADQTKSKYSTPGSSVWVSGFGGDNGNNTSHSGGTYYGGEAKPAIMTVDQSSCSKGYTKSGVSAGSGKNNNAFNNADHSENASCNYTSNFNGTSSAAPTVSGVVALMLQANSTLTWRDVKHILATTSTQIDSSNSKAYLGVNQYSWITNAAGHKHHNWYGFGKINGYSAVLAALNYTAGSLGTWVNSGLVQSGVINETFNSYNRALTSGLTVSAPAGSSGKIEFVRVGVSMTHAIPNDVGIELLSPDGTTVPILPAFTRVTTNPSGTLFEIGVNSLYGENMAGTWKLYITDYTNDSVSGILNSWEIKVYGN
jgi:subtilisin-like proprotein convertase family protein